MPPTIAGVGFVCGAFLVFIGLLVGLPFAANFNRRGGRVFRACTAIMIGGLGLMGGSLFGAITYCFFTGCRP